MTIESARINQALYIVEARLSDKLQEVKNDMADVKMLSNQSYVETVAILQTVNNLIIAVDDLVLKMQELVDEMKRSNGTLL